MATERVSLGDVLLIPLGEWQFQVLPGELVGRRQPRGGMLEIQTVLHDSVEGDSHEIGLREATRVARCPPWLKPFDRIQLETPTGPFGSASFHHNNDFVCVWYCYRPIGLILGAYACAWHLHTEREYRHAIGECESMLLSAVFNRPAWGATDPLTQSLLDPEAKPPPAPDVAPDVNVDPHAGDPPPSQELS